MQWVHLLPIMLELQPVGVHGQEHVKQEEAPTKMTFLYKLVQGVSERSFGLNGAHSSMICWFNLTECSAKAIVSHDIECG